LLAAAGCQNKESAGPSSEALVIPVSHPLEEMVTDYEEFTGRTDAVEVVDIRARVTGYLTKLPFREGSEVHKGDLLFEIDPRPYQAQLDNAQSQVDLNEASLKLAKATYERDRVIGASVASAVSQQQLDQDQAAVEEAAARIKSAKASTEVYKLNLEFCRVTSPIDGQVSRYYLTRGNLVNIDQTLLTTIVSLDPMYAYFDMDEPTLLRIRRAIIEGRINLPEDGVIPVQMGLQGEDGFPHNGSINFLNNQVNSSTGSITLRGVFSNPRMFGDEPSAAAQAVAFLGTPSGQGPLLALPGPVAGAGRRGTRLLSPGMFVRIRLPIGTPHRAVLVIDRAIQSDQGLKYVYVVDAENKVQYRRITTGALERNGLRVVRGVEPSELVVVGALQQAKPKMTVQPEVHPMPVLNSQAGSDVQDRGNRPDKPAKK
jgi:multidrug efflux system membrane fusion protein